MLLFLLICDDGWTQFGLDGVWPVNLITICDNGWTQFGLDGVWPVNLITICDNHGS